MSRADEHEARTSAVDASARVSRAGDDGAVIIRVDGRALRVEAGISVAAALQNAGLPCRRSVSGEARAPVCGMGVCHECRVAIDGIAQLRGCMIVVAPGMEVRTDA